tara:strand:+ start:582 stop:983 length:402 start_codon:yes stop_codon:yes gene_type:complete
MGDEGNSVQVRVLFTTLLAFVLVIAASYGNPLHADSGTHPHRLTAQLSVDLADDQLAPLPASPVASAFLHHNQSPQWAFVGMSVAAFHRSAANHYLLPVPIPLTWATTAWPDRQFVSGWKDTGLLFRIKNAYL